MQCYRLSWGTEIQSSSHGKGLKRVSKYESSGFCISPINENMTQNQNKSVCALENVSHTFSHVLKIANKIKTTVPSDNPTSQQTNRLWPSCLYRRSSPGLCSRTPDGAMPPRQDNHMQGTIDIHTTHTQLINPFWISPTHLGFVSRLTSAYK